MRAENKSAYTKCESITKENASNFYYAFRTLPTEKRLAIYATYAFCRLCDDIADGEQPVNQKRKLLNQVRTDLLKKNSGTISDPVFIALHDTMSTFNIPISYFEQLIDGVEMDLTIDHYSNFEDLRKYCYKVASVVGLICIEIFSYSNPKARSYAIDLGIGMQITNILRDIREDFSNGRIYLPMNELDQFRYSKHDLSSNIMNEPFRNLLAFQIDRARSYFDSGINLIPLVSPNSRVCLSMLHGVYSRILDRIESNDYDIYTKRIGLKTSEKIFLMTKIWGLNIFKKTKLF